MMGEPNRPQGFVNSVREQAGAQLTTQKDRATDNIGAVARAIKGTGRELRDQQYEGIANYVEQAADRLEQWSTTMRNKDAGELLRDTQNAARQRPIAFIGAAFALGLLTARFLKSSQPANGAGSARTERPHASAH
jgi:hypothetical protein